MNKDAGNLVLPRISQVSNDSPTPDDDVDSDQSDEAGEAILTPSPAAEKKN